jgi:hypothetical protein
MTFLYLATEDLLSEAVGMKMIQTEIGENVPVTTLRRNGFGYLKKKMRDFAAMAQRNIVVLMTDLDAAECAPSMKSDWFQKIEQSPKFIFRVAVRETESWLMADRTHFSAFLGVAENAVPLNPEGLADPKAELIRVARKGSRQVRAELVPARGAIAKQGIGYNDLLCQFVDETWDCRRASQNSDSLRRACRRLAEAAAHLAS